MAKSALSTWFENSREIFVSRRRGAYHRLNQDRKARVAPRLEAAIIEADIDKASAHLSPEEVDGVRLL